MNSISIEPKPGFRRGTLEPVPIVVSMVLTALLLLLGTTSIAAQQVGVISGEIVDDASAGVGGVRVELVRGQAVASSTSTDAAGRYRFEGVPAGEYLLRVVAADYPPIERVVSIGGIEAAVVDVALGVLRLTDVVATATATRAQIESERALIPGAVSVVAGEDLARRAVNGLADVLRYVPGIWAESSAGADELFFSSRGSNMDAIDYDKNGIKLLQDGLPVTSADGNNHNRVIDPLSVRYAVVARGANALSYGASTLGGAIDFVSPTARNSPPISIVANSGAYGPFNGRASIGAAGERLDGLLTVEGRRYEGYRDHSSQSRIGVYSNVGFKLSDDLELRLFGAYLDSDLELPGALTRSEIDSDPNQASAQALGGNYGKELLTRRLAARMEWSPAKDRSLLAGLSYETQSLFHPIVDKILVDFDGPGPLQPVEVFSLIVDTDHTDLGGVVRYNQRVGAHDLVVGANYANGDVDGGNYRNDAGRSNGITQYVDNRSESVELYLMDRWRLSDALTLVFGGQYVNTARDVRTTDAASGDTSNPKRRYTSINPRAGIIASVVPELEVYGNVSRLFEAPTTFQMEDNVAGGNATLDAMTGEVAEIGARSTPSQSLGARWNWDVALYYARIDDEVLSVDDPEAPGNSLTTNLDNTVHAGLEALAGVSVPIGSTHRIEPLVSLTVNRFTFAGDPTYSDNRLPAAPTYAARGEVMYRNARGLYFGPTFDLIGERYADFANTYIVEGYELLGLRAGVSTPQWDLFAELRNAFDVDYTATIGVLNRADANSRVLYPGAPRTAYIGARFSY